MKLIQAMKQIKDLQRKAEDLRGKIRQHCAYLSIEKAVYENQSETVRGWLQAHEDIMQTILNLRLAIQNTNLMTDVTIEIGGKAVTKSIAAWIHRRRDLAKADMDAWAQLSDRGLKEQRGKDSQGMLTEITIVRCYKPEERDQKLDIYRSEPMIIDATLEVTNAVTDLITLTQ